jgi:leucyl aminopeptidase
MRVTVKHVDPAGYKVPALAVFLFSDDKPSLASRPELESLKEFIAPRLRQKDFTADHLSTMTLFTGIKNGPERVIVIGLGEKNKLTTDRLKKAAAKAVRTAVDLKEWDLALLLPPGTSSTESAAVRAEFLTLGAALGNYQFQELKTKDKDKKKPVRRLTLIDPEKSSQKALKSAVDTALTTAESVALARDLGNRPANQIYPESLAAEARRATRGLPIKVTVLDAAAAQKRGMGAFLGVAQGSKRPGRIIILEYKGGTAKAKPVILVGKAITFDSGGLNIKTGEGMSHMKTDMCGGAAALGSVLAAAKLKLKKNIVGIIPAAENMPDGGSYRPGDVLKSMSGQTIEINNTDAEGRLVLADALTLAKEYNPAEIIDMATLTGACVIALGEKCAGAFGDDAMVESLRQSSDRTGERIWPMPLFEDYFEMMKSDVADFKNTGARSGGAITAGLFLKQFVDEKTPWVHLDIAGPARADKDTPDQPAGATGFGVQLVVDYLRNKK